MEKEIRTMKANNPATNTTNGSITGSNHVEITTAGSQFQQKLITLDGAVAIHAKLGESYRVVNNEGANLNNLVALRVFNNLEVYFDDNTQLIIEKAF
jgi:hypothetical protein